MTPHATAARLRQLLDGFSPEYRWFTGNTPIGFTAAEILCLCNAVEAVTPMHECQCERNHVDDDEHKPGCGGRP